MSGRRDRHYDSGGSSSYRQKHYDGGRDRHGSKGRHSYHDGDWICPGCGNNNFARRKQCNKCGEEKAYVKTKSGGVEIGKHLAEKSKGLFAADDWQCKMCGNVNWSRRSECNVCKAPKIGCVESRTGYGGGFNERESVEYKERGDSDGEYDEFGRKKKKFRGKSAEEPKETNNATHERDDKEKEDDDEEEEEDGNSDAYRLSDDEEEDGDDVSAYDLGESDEDNTEKNNAKSTDGDAHGDQSKKRSRSRSRSTEREIKKFAES